ncbi:MAG: hypothetical protein SH859_17210 [Hyphomicrobium aestuarii]|nr:hypothetical protein [Hyphomicrobium aestuarii]
MSRIEGLSGIEARLESLGVRITSRVDQWVVDEVVACQAEAVDLCPVHTGKARSLLAAPSAVRRVGKGASARVVFAAPSGAYYLKFVEFGTKAYVPGVNRRAGKDKRGKQRFRKVSRGVPARRAYPFFRPAVANMFVRLRRGRNLRTVLGL